MKVKKIKNIVDNGYRLFGCGDLNDYGEYTLVVADSKEKAYEILVEKSFGDWGKQLLSYKEHSRFNEEGKALNGSAVIYSECRKEGLYDMDETELLKYYKEKIFPIDDVVDLRTNIWEDEHVV